MVSEVTWYIGGTVRSGSTLLTGLLAQACGGVNVGEVHILWRSFGLGRTCTCGRPLRDCEIWSRVVELVLKRTGLASTSAAAIIEGREPRQREVALRGMRVEVQDEVVELRRETEAAVREVTGAGTLVDSSKSAGTLVVALRSATAVRAVHLVRDPRAVAYSMTHPKPDPSLAGRPLPVAGPLHTSLSWLGTNMAFERLDAAASFSLKRLRYEDLFEAPVEVVRSIVGEGTDLPVQTMISGAQHAVAGNPWQFEPTRRLEHDRRWERGLSRQDSFLVALTTLPLLLRYGYEVRMSSRTTM